MQCLAPLRSLLLASLMTTSAWAQFQLMPPEKLASYRNGLPRIADAHWDEIVRDPATILYTDEEMPPAYQFEGGFHSPKYNISANGSEPIGNGNREFPWKVPGGTDPSEKTTSSFKLLRLPTREDGTAWPVVTWRGQLPQSSNGLKWIFPHGTILGEALTVRDSKGAPHVFELRLRIRQAGYWDVEILRPFPSQKDFEERLAKVAPELAQKIPATNKTGMVVERLRDTNHRSRHSFDVEAAIAELPELPEELAIKLLGTPFKSAVGAKWCDDDEGNTAFAPTARQAFSIVPSGYRGTFLGTSHTSCMKCHDSTLVNVRLFDGGRDWYGHIRGSADGIFSFHPVDPGSISYNGYQAAVNMRQSLLDAGVVARFDPQKHPASQYTLLTADEKPE